MVYIKKWADFTAQCIALYEASPTKTRYVMRIRPSDNWLILKVTDDAKTLQYKTRSAIILNRFEQFNRDMLAAVAGRDLPSRAEAAAREAQAKADAAKAAAKAAEAAAAAAKGAPAAKDAKDAKGGAQQAGTGAAASGQQSVSAGGGGGGGANKKKKKKGKK